MPLVAFLPPNRMPTELRARNGVNRRKCDLGKGRRFDNPPNDGILKIDHCIRLFIVKFTKKLIGEFGSRS
jgi:hypothetical protein